jgi:long-chain-fatty-acid---luciferin-component ligase
MTELNGALLECEHHVKHLPPFIHLSIRNPSNLDEEIPFGEEGLPLFLDPMAHSYPGFIIADDNVAMAVAPSERCACGRIGPALTMNVRRAQGAEEKGCGRHVAELKDELTK